MRARRLARDPRIRGALKVVLEKEGERLQATLHGLSQAEVNRLVTDCGRRGDRIKVTVLPDAAWDPLGSEEEGA